MSKEITWVNVRMPKDDVAKLDKIVSARRSYRTIVAREMIVNAIENYEKEKGVIL